MFFALPNFSSQVVRKVVEPWNEAPAPADKLAMAKLDFRAWCTESTTQHTFISAVEGLDPLTRTTAKGENPPVILHGLIADHDTDIEPARLTAEYVASRKKGDFLPNYVCRSQGGGVHAIYLFESPVKVASAEMAEVFMEHCFKRLKADSFYPALKKESWDPYQYFELGTNWVKISDTPLPDNHVWHWLYEAGNKIKFTTDLRDTVIPMARVSERVDELFPGKWDGATFEPGARGSAFWVADSKTPRCAIVREGGMQCFLSSQPPFVPWSAILGRAWCEKFHADRIGEVIKNYWFEEETRNFWELDVSLPRPRPINFSEKHMERELRLAHGITRKKLDNADGTELDAVIHRVTREKRVAKVSNFLFRPVGLVHGPDSDFLNISTVRVLAPAPAGTSPLAWGEKFDFIAAFIQSLFRTPAHMRPTNLNQLEFFLAYLKYFYCNARLMTPMPGQVCFLCGPQDIGKTFLVDKILAPLMAGPGASAEPCEDYAFGRTEFNMNLSQTPIWKIDDKRPKGSAEHSHYSTFVKVTAADATLRVRRMRTDPAKTMWPGRLFILMNMDPSSAVLLPSTEASMLQKMNFFLCQRHDKFKFPSRTTGDRLVAEQLPYFARFLMDWKIPAHCVTAGKNVRYGVTTYHDTSVRRLAFEQGTTFGFFEYLLIFLSNYKMANPAATEWVGTAGELSVQMAEILGRSRDLSSTGVGRSLSILESRGAGLRQKHHHGLRQWHIPLALTVPEDVDDGDDIAKAIITGGVDPSVESLDERIEEAEKAERLPETGPDNCDYSTAGEEQKQETK